MRLTELQRTIIRQTISRIVGTDARVILFGSRLDDSARGGDLDLLVERDELPTLMQRSRIKLALEYSLVMPVDIVAIKRGHNQPHSSVSRLQPARPLEVRDMWKHAEEHLRTHLMKRHKVKDRGTGIIVSRANSFICAMGYTKFR